MSLSKKDKAAIGIPTRRVAPLHQSRWHHEAKADYIVIRRGARFYAWDGRYFDRKERATGHMNAIIQKQMSGHPQKTKKGVMETWTFRVYKTQHGWGVFFKE